MRRSIATCIHRGELPQGYEIQNSDIGRGLGLPAEGFGVVLPCDVGKRVFCKAYITQMENEAQRDERKGVTTDP